VLVGKDRDQRRTVPQRAPPLANGGRGHVALRQKIAPQTVANLARVNAIVLLFRRRNSPQHQRMRYLQRGGTWLQVMVDPPGENRGFHRCSPRLGQCFHPMVQIQTRGGDRAFGVNHATAILNAKTARPLVNIQPDVIHGLHGGASLVSLNQLGR
jgi:hypothetical protein